jgi:response regulator of citrate/malate metabolism
MPFQYKPKEKATRRNTFTKQQIANALEDVEKGMSLRKTAMKYSIDRTTLRRYMKDKEKLKKFDEMGSHYRYFR